MGDKTPMSEKASREPTWEERRPEQKIEMLAKITRNLVVAFDRHFAMVIALRSHVHDSNGHVCFREHEARRSWLVDYVKQLGGDISDHGY